MFRSPNNVRFLPAVPMARGVGASSLNVSATTNFDIVLPNVGYKNGILWIGKTANSSQLNGGCLIMFDRSQSSAASLDIFRPGGSGSYNSFYSRFAGWTQLSGGFLAGNSGPNIINVYLTQITANNTDVLRIQFGGSGTIDFTYNYSVQ